MVYLFEVKKKYELESIAKKALSMPVERYYKFLNYKNYEDKLNCVIAYLLLENHLSKSKSEVNLIKLDFNKFGKPIIEKLNFNISHSDKIIGVAVDEINEIGLDIEPISNFDSVMINYMFDEQDTEKYKKEISNNVFVSKVWSMKEAYLKLKGYGLSANMSNVKFQYEYDKILINDIYIQSFKYNNNWISIASKNIEEKIIIVEEKDIL